MSEDFINLIKIQNKGNCGGPPKPPNTYTVGNLQDCYRLPKIRVEKPLIEKPRPEVREKRPPSTFGTIMAKIKEKSEKPSTGVKVDEETIKSIMEMPEQALLEILQAGYAKYKEAFGNTNIEDLPEEVQEWLRNSKI